MKIISIDFDGVLHSYTSGWQGATNIPDPPVEGALDFLYELLQTPDIEINIFSSRRRYFGGKKAMLRWIQKAFRDDFMATQGSRVPRHKVTELLRSTLDEIARGLKFPLLKPPSHVLLDDRAITFDGTFPDVKDILDFKPWNKRGSI